MFSLLLTITSIALVIALAAATMSTGGSATLTNGRIAAESAGSLNELSQIRAAMSAYQADKGAAPASLNDLIPTYLTSIPLGWGNAPPVLAAFEAKVLSGDAEHSLSVCKSVNEKLGVIGSPPRCVDIPDNFAGCCVDS